MLVGIAVSLKQVLKLDNVAYRIFPNDEYKIVDIIDPYVKLFINDLKLNDIKINITFVDKNLYSESGQLSYAYVYSNNKYNKNIPFKITVDKRFDLQTIIIKIAHELRHVYQMVTNRLTLKNNEWYWDGARADKRRNVSEWDCARYETRMKKTFRRALKWRQLDGKHL